MIKLIYQLPHQIHNTEKVEKCDFLPKENKRNTMRELDVDSESPAIEWWKTTKKLSLLGVDDTISGGGVWGYPSCYSKGTFLFHTFPNGICIIKWLLSYINCQKWIIFNKIVPIFRFYEFASFTRIFYFICKWNDFFF